MTPYRYLFVLIATLFLSACVNLGGGTPETRHYLLDSVIDRQHEATDTGVDGLRQAIIAMAPLELAGYLDRPQVVIRIDGNRLHLADYDRWGEPLPEMMTRVLRENIVSLGQVEAIVDSHSPQAKKADAVLRVTIKRFEGVAGREAALAARYTVQDTEQRKILESRELKLTKELATGGPQALIDAMSRLLEELSFRMARDLASQVGKGKTGQQSQN
ncbi:MAG: hypothetical protein C0616_10340 [Desulfuromonas sp.]|nr:MAG: hypothetical protein C0616_10340 [Desulfuromonas sp.]